MSDVPSLVKISATCSTPGCPSVGVPYTFMVQSTVVSTVRCTCDAVFYTNVPPGDLPEPPTTDLTQPSPQPVGAESLEDD